MVYLFLDLDEAETPFREVLLLLEGLLSADDPSLLRLLLATAERFLETSPLFEIGLETALSFLFLTDLLFI